VIAVSETIGDVLLVVGAGFSFLASVGILRFHDTYSRMHAASKGPTLGLLLVSVGAALRIESFGATVTLALVVVLQFLTAPLAAHLVGRSIHKQVTPRVDEIDELARDETAAGSPGPSPGGGR
jgi:multicomponent Na+:H+ antiporter subunit G